jgi:hypothetical protein
MYVYIYWKRIHGRAAPVRERRERAQRLSSRFFFHLLFFLEVKHRKGAEHGVGKKENRGGGRSALFLAAFFGGNSEQKQRPCAVVLPITFRTQQSLLLSDRFVAAPSAFTLGATTPLLRVRKGRKTQKQERSSTPFPSFVFTARTRRQLRSQQRRSTWQRQGQPHRCDASTGTGRRW